MTRAESPFKSLSRDRDSFVSAPDQKYQLAVGKRRVVDIVLVTKRRIGGVGDYSAILADELAKNGCEVAMFCIHDRDVQDVVEISQATTGHPVQIIRIPSAWEWNQKHKIMRNLLCEMSPRVISLQISRGEFGATRKSILKTARCLAVVCEGFDVSIMFHEFMTGRDLQMQWLSDPNPWYPVQALRRYRIKRTIRKIVAMLQPQSIAATTHMLAQLYNSILGAEVGVIPLFGNIPVQAKSDAGRRCQVLSRIGVDIDAKTRERSLLWAHFGSGWPHGDGMRFTISALEQFSTKAGKKAILIFLGYSSHRLERVCREYDCNVEIVGTGPLEAKEISQVFHCVDFGFTSYPYCVARQSGAVASMIEHNLPVVATWDLAIADGHRIFTRSEGDLTYLDEHGVSWKEQEERNAADDISRRVVAIRYLDMWNL